MTYLVSPAFMIAEICEDPDQEYMYIYFGARFDSFACYIYLHKATLVRPLSMVEGYQKEERDRQKRAESTTRDPLPYIGRKLFCMRAWAFRSSSFWAAASFSFERWPFVGRVVSGVGRVLKERCCLPRCSSSGTGKLKYLEKSSIIYEHFAYLF